jgi:hypothetical protein
MPFDSKSHHSIDTKIGQVRNNISDLGPRIQVLVLP